MKVLMIVALACAAVAQPAEPRDKRSYAPLHYSTLDANSVSSSSYHSTSLHSAQALPTYHHQPTYPIAYSIQPSYSVAPRVETVVSQPRVYEVQTPVSYAYPVRQQVYREPVQTYEYTPQETYTPLQTYNQVQTYAPVDTYASLQAYRPVQSYAPLRTYNTAPLNWHNKNVYNYNTDPWC